MKIAVLVLTGGKIRPNTKRKSFDSFGFLGLKMIVDEIINAGNNVAYCTMATVKDYDMVLFSITAPEDITTFLNGIKKGEYKKGNCFVVAGGAGCINICSIYDFIDMAVLGRAEGQAAQIINKKVAPNIWIKKDDPRIEGVYQIRQVNQLHNDENGCCGCRNKCFFCQYTWTRKRVGKNYSAGKEGYTINEEDFKSLALDKPGRYTTGIDGLSYKTRKRVNKGFVTDELIRKKFEGAISNGHEKAYMLKLFGIVGYPWETVQSARGDAKKFGKLFEGIDDKYSKGRLMAAMHLTPFSPEPLTPMEHVPVNIGVNWRRVFGGRSYALINNERINVFIGPYTTTAPTLSRRNLINRCRLNERQKIFKIITSKLDGVEGHEINRKVKNYLGRDIFGWQKPGEIVPFLKTYNDYTKIGNKFFKNEKTQ
jgi:radical SAM superfamily enzyme YgiQ (UPF0313 family)